MSKGRVKRMRVRDILGTGVVIAAFCLPGLLSADSGVLPPLKVAVIRGFGSAGMPKYGSAVPEELKLTADEVKARAERQWAEAKEIGYVPRLAEFKAGHSFGTFVGKFWNSDRWCLGLMPNGKRGVDLENVPGYFPKLSKMCVSNDRLVDEKVANWVKAGKPACLSCGENDGLLGYCRCEKCRALDADLPGERFIRHKSDRYVDFWNRVCEKARAIRPDVKVTVHLYSVLRHPPRKAKIRYPDNLMCSYVPSLQDADPCGDIRRWKAAGLKNFYTRPNWLCAYSPFPLGLSRKIYDLHRGLFALGSIGMDEDCVSGNPAIGLEICTLEHLCADPNVSFEKIEDWWYGRFGAARATVEAYNRQVVSRCDREWPKFLRWLQEMDIAFLDDGGIPRFVNRLHTVEELESDCAILDRFDASGLTGEAAWRFAALKDNARHAVLTKRMLISQNAADKAALAAFRKAHRLTLGLPWKRVYAGIEKDLWGGGPELQLRRPEWSHEAGAEWFEEGLRPGTPGRKDPPWLGLLR